ncbi:hypothetical protein Dcae01_01732 [Deinococcus caeni]|uniref:Uncharacterized protein n=1 Tax=Deinococcus caeni TaxID=569127 RepID=A0ABP9UIX0_9DEIO
MSRAARTRQALQPETAQRDGRNLSGAVCAMLGGDGCGGKSGESPVLSRNGNPPLVVGKAEHPRRSRRPEWAGVA